VIVPTIPENDHDAVVTALEQQTTDSFDVLVVNDPDLGVCEARNLGLERGRVISSRSPTTTVGRPPAGSRRLTRPSLNARTSSSSRAPSRAE